MPRWRGTLREGAARCPRTRPRFPARPVGDVLRGGLGLAAVAGTGTLLAACSGGSTADAAADGTVTITMWHGQADQGKETLDKLVAAFEKQNPKIKVDASSGGVLADSMLQKITTALSSGQYPDIAYIFGPDIASVARSPHVAHLGDLHRRRRAALGRLLPRRPGRGDRRR